MAAPDAGNIVVASPLVTGGILTAPVGTALPTNTSTALNSAFVATGMVGEDGVTMTIDRTTEDVMAWGGSKARVITTAHAVQFQFTLLETNPDTLALVFGDDNVVTVDDLTTVKLNSDDLPHFAMVIAAADGDKAVRIAVADAQVVAQEDVTFVHSAPTQFTVTVECFPDSSGDKATLLYSDGS